MIKETELNILEKQDLLEFNNLLLDLFQGYKAFSIENLKTNLPFKDYVKIFVTDKR